MYLNYLRSPAVTWGELWPLVMLNCKFWPVGYTFIGGCRRSTETTGGNLRWPAVTLDEVLNAIGRQSQLDTKKWQSHVNPVRLSPEIGTNRLQVAKLCGNYAWVYQFCIVALWTQDCSHWFELFVSMSSILSLTHFYGHNWDKNLRVLIQYLFCIHP